MITERGSRFTSAAVLSLFGYAIPARLVDEIEEGLRELAGEVAAGTAGKGESGLRLHRAMGWLHEAGVRGVVCAKNCEEERESAMIEIEVRANSLSSGGR